MTFQSHFGSTQFHGLLAEFLEKKRGKNALGYKMNRKYPHLFAGSIYNIFSNTSLAHLKCIKVFSIQVFQFSRTLHGWLSLKIYIHEKKTVKKTKSRIWIRGDKDL